MFFPIPPQLMSTLKFINKLTPAPRVIAPWARAGNGCVRTAFQWYQTGRTVIPSMDTEILQTAALPVWTNPLMTATLAAGVKLVKPTSGDGCGCTGARRYKHMQARRACACACACECAHRK